MTQYKVEMRDVDRRSWNDVGRFLIRMMSKSLIRRMSDSFLMRMMKIMNMMIGMIETMKVKRMMNDIIMKKRRSNFQKSFQRRAKNQR